MLHYLVTVYVKRSGRSGHGKENPRQ